MSLSIFVRFEQDKEMRFSDWPVNIKIKQLTSMYVYFVQKVRPAILAVFHDLSSSFG